MVSTADRSLHTPRRRRSLLTGRRTKGIRPCFSTSAVRYYGNTPWVSRFFRDIRLLFYCGDVMIIVTGPYTCGAVMNHRAVVLSICPGVMRVKRETGQKPVRARHCRSGVHEHCPSQTDQSLAVPAREGVSCAMMDEPGNLPDVCWEKKEPGWEP